MGASDRCAVLPAYRFSFSQVKARIVQAQARSRARSRLA
jgi:hypothetical protein